MNVRRALVEAAQRALSCKGGISY